MNENPSAKLLENEKDLTDHNDNKKSRNLLKTQQKTLKNTMDTKKNTKLLYNDSRDKYKIYSIAIMNKEIGLKKDDTVYLDDEKIHLAMNSGNSRFEPKIWYRELIVYSWVKTLFTKHQKERYTFSRHEATDKIKEFATKHNFPFVNSLYQLIACKY
ncbi:MAG: hypothetical protein ACXABI_06190 [Candidatus Hodarchaeales archaeon]